MLEPELEPRQSGCYGSKERRTEELVSTQEVLGSRGNKERSRKSWGQLRKNQLIGPAGKGKEWEKRLGPRKPDGGVPSFLLPEYGKGKP